MKPQQQEKYKQLGRNVADMKIIQIYNTKKYKGPLFIKTESRV